MGTGDNIPPYQAVVRFYISPSNCLQYAQFHKNPSYHTVVSVSIKWVSCMFCPPNLQHSSISRCQQDCCKTLPQIGLSLSICKTLTETFFIALSHQCTANRPVSISTLTAHNTYTFHAVQQFHFKSAGFHIHEDMS